MNIAIVGLGRVGTALGVLLSRANNEIVSAFDTLPAARERFARRVSCAIAEQLSDLSDKADLVLIAVPDSAIGHVSKSLSVLPAARKGLYVGHTSGAIDSLALHDLQARGCNTFSMHPVQTFASIDSAIRALPGSYFAVEGTKEAVEFALEEIVAPIGGHGFTIDSSAKPLYHASLSAASNFLVTLLDLAFRLMEQAGIDRTLGLEMMLPLIRTTIMNFEVSDAEALTGPIERGDEATLRKQLDAVAKTEHGLCSLYIALARATIDLANEKGSIDNKVSDQLVEILRRVDNPEAQE